MDPAKFTKFFQSKIFKYILWGVGVLIILLVGFAIGMMVGFKKADFSYRWGENYHRNFGGPAGGFFQDFRGFRDRDFIDANGTFGQIIKIDNQTLVIKGNADAEKVVLVKDAISIKHGRDDVKFTDLKVDDYVTVIGAPNDAGQIEAKLIRLMPAPPLAPPGFPPPPGFPRQRP